MPITLIEGLSMDEKQRLLDKSIEAFILGLEIYNKPTIKYRVEGFSFFVVNAWELMLKAELINQNKSIYYRDKPDRTLSIDKVIEAVFPDKHGSLRKNLEQIIDLRNTSTHYITEDYEYIYAPLFQACVINFVNKIKEFHDIDITKYIAQNFLTLSIRLDFLSENEINTKYSAQMAKRILSDKEKISTAIDTGNSAFAIPLQTKLYITKDKHAADLQVSVVKDADVQAGIIREVKDPHQLFPYTTSTVVKLVNRRLKIDGILITKRSGNFEKKTPFTKNDFQLILQFYDIKSNSNLCYHYVLGNRYSYAASIVDRIVDLIKKDPDNFVQNLKDGIRKR